MRSFWTVRARVAGSTLACYDIIDFVKGRRYENMDNTCFTRKTGLRETRVFGSAARNRAYLDLYIYTPSLRYL